jgi:hypothetical protein
MVAEMPVPPRAHRESDPVASQWLHRASYAARPGERQSEHNANWWVGFFLELKAWISTQGALSHL